QLSYWNAEAPGGVSGLAPHRSATQRDSPSLSMATAFSAPHILPSGSLPQGAVVWYGLGRSLVGWTSSCVSARPLHNVSAATVSNIINHDRSANGMEPSLRMAFDGVYHLRYA